MEWIIKKNNKTKWKATHEWIESLLLSFFQGRAVLVESVKVEKLHEIEWRSLCRSSVSGFLIFLQCCILKWQSFLDFRPSCYSTFLFFDFIVVDILIIRPFMLPDFIVFNFLVLYFHDFDFLVSRSTNLQLFFLYLVHAFQSRNNFLPLSSEASIFLSRHLTFFAHP